MMSGDFCGDKDSRRFLKKNIMRVKMLVAKCMIAVTRKNSLSKSEQQQHSVKVCRRTPIGYWAAHLGSTVPIRLRSRTPARGVTDLPLCFSGKHPPRPLSNLTHSK